MSNLKLIIRKAKEFYFKEWRGNEKVSPAFNEKVYITRLGWNHITHHPRRKLVDKIICLKKLSLARELLETASTYQTLQIKGRYRLYGLQAIVGDTRIKVVVSSKGERRRKILYSVMFKSLAKQTRRNIDKHNKKIVREFLRRNCKQKARVRKRK